MSVCLCVCVCVCVCLCVCVSVQEDAERMLCGPEPEQDHSSDFSIVDQIIKQLQQSILAVDKAIGANTHVLSLS